VAKSKAKSNRPLLPTHLHKEHSETETKGTAQYSKNIYRTILMTYRPFLGRIGLCLFLGIFGRALLLANTNVIGFWVDSLVGKSTPLNQMSSVEIVELLLTMTLVGFSMTLVFRVGFSRLSAKAISNFYDEVTLRTSRLPMGFFDTTPAGRIITRFSSDYGNIFRLFGGPLAEFISIIFDLIMMVILIGIANPIYLIFVLFIGLVNLLVYRLNRDHLRKVRRDLSASRSPSIAHFAETTQGASTIRSFRRQDSFIERFEDLDRYYLGQKLYTTREIIGFSFQMNSMSSLLLLITGVAAYFMVEKNWASIGSVGVAFSFIALSGNTVQMFFEWLTQFEEAMIGVERLDHYLRMDLEKGNKLPASAQFQTGHPVYEAEAERNLSLQRLTEDPNASVQIKNLWFRYRDDLPWVLKNLNLDIKAGERLGIVGRTGSGKSSLIQALFYLYPIEKGEISIHGLHPKLNDDGDIDLNLYRKAMAFISQDPILFRGSLRFNLDVENVFSDEKLRDVLQQVGLWDWVDTQALKLNMRIEENGKNLSLGERQLLCMARCLLQQAPIVIMDEATSSVDPQSEEILVRATEEFFAHRTQIIIAHRLSTLAKCDRILWLQNGEIFQLGPTDEVLPRFKQAELV
jgi:ABC-type multidrug transport system fused ATPase/permease subunit